MDDAAEDKLVKKTYGRAWAPWLYIITGAFVFALLSFIVLCALLGTPFSYEVDALLFTISYEGWLDTKPYMWAVWMALGFTPELSLYFADRARRVRRVMRIYTRDCDEELCLRVLRRAVDYGKEKRIYRRFDMRCSLYFSLENGYVHLLCTSGRVEEAREYMENGWLRRKGYLYRDTLCAVDYAEAAVAGDEPRARAAAARAGKLKRGNYGVQATLSALRGEYAAAIELAGRQADSTDAGLVEYTYFTARCYERMGDTDMAAERYGYAAENGGTMRCAQKAREWLAARESAQ